MTHWPTHRLGDLVDVLSGFAFESERFGNSGDLPIVRIRDVVPGQSSTFYEGDYDEKYVVQNGDVLIGMDGEFNRARWRGGRALLNQRVCRIASVTDDLDDAYLFHFLPKALWAIERVTPFVTVKHLSAKQIRDIAIPLPPLSEQRRIAEVLDRAEVLRAKRRAAHAQLDTLTQSIFLDMFGDPATNPKGWPFIAFGQLGENQDSQRVPVKSSDRGGRKGQYPYYGASGIIDWVDEYIYDGERLLIGEDGANLVVRATPVAYMARGKYWVNNHAHVIAENGRAHLRFLEFVVEQLDLKPFISGTAQPKLNRSNLDRIPVPLPPLALQHDFARRVAAVEKLKAAYRAALAELDALFAALQHRAFRGEL